MSKLHFNFQTMSSYRHNDAKRGYNPFDYPEEWKFFKHPFAMVEEDDILKDLLFQIRKMARRIHLFFDNDSRLETAFYFSIMDSLSEVDDYLLGALKYARYCRLEKLFLLAANSELAPFFEKLDLLKEELFSKISSFGERIVEFNRECHVGDMFMRQYCHLTQHGIPDDMLRALLRSPNYPFTSIILDDKTNLWSYTENTRVEIMLTKKEKNIEGACDLSVFDDQIEPIDMLLWHIRGTLLWMVIKKIILMCRNTQAYRDRHNKLVGTMCKDAYEEVCGVYARSKTYTQRRDKELPQQCADQLFLKGRKPTDVEVHTYFNTQYRILILQHNKSQELFFRYRNQLETFYVEFLNLLMNEKTHEDAIDFLFFQTYGKEISSKIQNSDNIKSKKIKKFCEFIKDAARADEIIKKLHRLIGYKTNTDALKIITRAMWIEWLDKKPTATSIKNEFPTITCKDSQISEILNEAKPTKGGVIDEEAIESIRKVYEAV